MSMLDTAKAAMKSVLAQGAEQAKVVVSRSRGVDIEWREGALEKVQERTQRSLSVEVFVDGRYSASSTNDLRASALDGFFAEAVAMTRFLEPDPHRGLPDPERYEGRAEVDLELCDPTYASFDSEARRKVCSDLEGLIREGAGDLPIVSVATSFGDSHGQSVRLHSDGFEGQRESTTSSFSAMITVKEPDGRRPMGWDYSAARHRADLGSLEACAAEALRRSRAQLGAGKLDTGRYTVVVDQRAVPRLLGALLAPIHGPSLQQRRSLWEGKLGTKIASELLTLMDTPHIVRGLGSGLWNSDGFASVRRPLIEEGVLKTYLIDQYYARKMGVEPTGGDTFNLEWAYGDKDQTRLIAQVGEGVYIDRLLGGNSNETTGELSMGCAGRVIRNGELAEPVAEVNLAGHFGTLWENLVAVGNDPDLNRASRPPTCVFEDVQLSGA